MFSSKKHRQRMEEFSTPKSADTSSSGDDTKGENGGRKTATSPKVVWSEAGTAEPVKARWEDFSGLPSPQPDLVQFPSDQVARKMNRCKRKHRTSLSLGDWQRYNFIKEYGDIREKYVKMVEGVKSKALQLGSCEAKAGERPPLATWVPHIDSKDYSLDRFIDEYEKPYRPVCISGLADDWGGRSKWTLPALASGAYRNCRLKCGEDDDGYSIKIKMKYFLQYLRQNKDDSPLYLFDSSYDENNIGKALLEDYNLPKYFRADLFRLVGERRRPPYRWFLVGPERSGSNLHIDPLGTSAWNTLITGRKLWVLFKPEAPKKLAKGKHLRRKGEDDEAITYFGRVLPRIIAEEEAKKDGPSMGMKMFIQEPGQTVFIPGGWWHAVLNLEDSTAVTQNFCSEHNFGPVWRKTRKGRKHMARRFLEKLKEDYPHLHKQALDLNKQDNFEFVFSDRKKKKKKKKEKEKEKKEKDQKRSRSGSEDGGKKEKSKKRSSDDMSDSD